MSPQTAPRVLLLLASLGAMTPVVGAEAGSLAPKPSATTPAAAKPVAAAALKAVVLAVAEERMRLAREAGLPVAAEEADLATAKALDPATFAVVVTKAPQVTLFKPVAVTVGNPHLEALVAKAKARLAKPDGVWRRATATTSAFNDSAGVTTRSGSHAARSELGGDFGVRSTAIRLREDLWLFGNPASPLVGNPELLTRLLRRAHAFADAYALHEQPDTTAKPDLYDQFAAEQALSGLVEFRTAYAALLTPGQRAAWDATLRLAADRLWKMMEKAKAWNLNIETARMVGVLNLSCLLGDQERIDKVLSHVDLVISKMHPDGGWPYNGDSNPSVNYHDELLYSLLRIYDITGHAPIATALTAAQWKPVVMGRTDEFWTSPFHKTYRWNYPRGVECGPEAVATLSGNGYVRTLMDSNRDYGNREDLAWYRQDVVAKPLPDGVTYPDRNVGGPRAWYGRFTYGGTFRQVPAKEVGHETLMGCMTVDEDGRLNSVLTAVTPRVRMWAEDRMDAKGGVEETAWGKLTAAMTGVFTTGRQVSAASAVHRITTVRKGAYQGSTAGWQARQLWLGLPDRIIGLVSTVPVGDGAPAYEVDGVLRFISGGSAGAATPKTLVDLGQGRYRYGELDLVVHASTYGAVEAREVAYRQPKFPAHELTFRAQAGEAPAEAVTFPASTDLTMVVEVRPSWATGEATVAVTTEGPVLALDAVVGAKTFHLRFNASEAPASTSLTAAGAASLRLTDAAGTSVPVREIPGKLDLAPGQQGLVIVSPDAQDHLPGWTSFEEMVSPGGSPTR